MQTFTKKELVRLVSNKMEINQQFAGEVVQCTLDSLVEALAEHGRIELRNFGIFEVKERKPHIGMNIKTGEKIAIDRRFAITFVPGKFAAEHINEQFQSREMD